MCQTNRIIGHVTLTASFDMSHWPHHLTCLTASLDASHWSLGSFDTSHSITVAAQRGSSTPLFFLTCFCHIKRSTLHIFNITTNSLKTWPMHNLISPFCPLHWEICESRFTLEYTTSSYKTHRTATKKYMHRCGSTNSHEENAQTQHYVNIYNSQSLRGIGWFWVHTPS